MRIARLLILGLAVAILSGVALADTVDPAIGIRGGTGSIGLFGPTFSFTFTGTKGTTTTTQPFFFINSTGRTVGEVDFLAPGSPDPGSPPISGTLAYACNNGNDPYFSDCTTTPMDNGNTLFRYFGGPGIPNDPHPICDGPNACSPSAGNQAADFEIFVQSLNGDLAALPTADRFTVPGTLIPAAVPEPSTLVLMSTGLGCAGLIRRRRNKKLN